jgi:2-C-methyl-D-erythritol 4-phosphate cytidylyltransferase
MKQKTGALITAAGDSQRMGQIDKIFAKLGKRTLLHHVLNTFQLCPAVDQIVLVLSEQNVKRGKSLVKRYGLSKVTDVCAGGLRRQDSVKQGLDLLTDCDLVIVHDGARPMITSDLIEKGIATAKANGTAVAAVPATNTIKLADSGDYVVKTLQRENLWEIQTPQVFRYAIIAHAYEDIGDDVTDDATLVERNGHKVKLYMASYDNIKVTTVEDLYLARLILKTRGK